MNAAGNASLSHILYIETHIHVLDKIHQNNKTMVGTVHLPISQWKTENLDRLSKLKQVIILYKEEIDFFAKYIPVERIKYIRHGVDINFFKPGLPAAVNKNKILFVGHYLRNFPMFLNVYRQLQKQLGDLEIHFIIPSFHRNIPELNELSGKAGIFFHEKLSDEELLEQYQQSYLLVMPMQDSGANTAIIQAIATGLPIVTTDAGGIRSYGGGDIYPVIANDDHDAMVDLCMRYFKDENYRNSMSADLRNFAVQQLDWDKIAAAHVNVFSSLMN